MKADRLQWLALHALFICLVLGLAEWAAARRWLDPTFFGQPSGVAAYLWNHAGTARFWSDLGWTLAAVACSFVLGSVAAFATGWPSCAGRPSNALQSPTSTR